MKPLPFAASFVLLLGMILGVRHLAGCKDAKSAVDTAQHVADTSCKIVEAFTPDGVQHQICAVEQELSSIVDIIRASRLDAGPRYAARCKFIPGTETCATAAETAHAIDVVLAARRDQ